MATYLTMFSSGVSVNPLSGAQTIKSKIPIGNRPMIDFPTVSLVQCLLFFWRAVGGPGGKFVSVGGPVTGTPGRIDGRPGPGISNSPARKCFKTRRIFPQRENTRPYTQVDVCRQFAVLTATIPPHTLHSSGQGTSFIKTQAVNWGTRYLLSAFGRTSVNKRESREIIAAVNFSLVPYQNSFRLGGLSFPS
ncbi:hypothetical protein Bbelb_026800 [Branchiostoma belcheri]|nr:hypothetical protein Bbelb_026800 [Branchiostoma belcheri]